MFARFWNYIKTAIGMKAEAAMDPAVQIEQAVNEARKQDRELRDQAARVVAHRTELQMKLDRSADASAKAKANATAAVMKVKAAQEAGNAEDAEKWTRVAQSMAMELETQENIVEGLKAQFTTAQGQAELAKKQVNENAMRLKELTAKRMELVGKLEQARMQESVNKTLEAINRPLDNAGPSLSEIEDKINKRMALAGAQAELESSSLEGLEREIESSTRAVAGQARLDSLMAELGVGSGDGATDVEAKAVESTTSASTANESAGYPNDPVALLDDGGVDVDKLNAELAAEPVEADGGKSEQGK